MKSLVFSVFLSIGLFSSLNAQFDRYDFVVVPTKFDVFFESNAYRTSTLLKFLLTEAGYKAYYEDELPEYALQNPKVSGRSFWTCPETDIARTGPLRMPKATCGARIMATPR